MKKKVERTEIKDIAEEFNNFNPNVGPNLAKKSHSLVSQIKHTVK